MLVSEDKSKGWMVASKDGVEVVKEGMVVSKDTVELEE